ncbi:MAG: pimeloyl-ACP methyl ester esterase BioH [Gammaproteobacteria bacterium]
MTLYQHTLGQGCPVVAVHGWGLNSGVWIETQRQLSAHYRVTLVDLPGYGESRGFEFSWQLEGVVEAVADVIAEPSVWMGWSLGGMVALAAAQRCPNKVRALVLVASTPCFVQKPDWPHGLAGKLLQSFADGLTQDYEATLWRFLTLQAGQGEGARSVIKRLRRELLQGGVPEQPVLRAGLAVLQSTDLRPLLGWVQCPTLMILGQWDVLVSPASAQAVSVLRPDWQVAILAKSAHAPFLSHQTAFLARLQVFLDEVC